MNARAPSADVLGTLLYEVLEVSTMLLFILSGIATTRRKRQIQPGVAHPLELPGLPEFCIFPCLINVPDDDLYGPAGTAAQLAYKGWIAEIYGIWENRLRNELKGTVGKNAIRPEMDAFGDLRHIRNDLLHSGTASEDESGRCTILKWFLPGEAIILRTRHVLDFLNQTGILSLHVVYDSRSRSGALNVHHTKEKLLAWTPKPNLISVRTAGGSQTTDPPYKGVTVVFDNGLYANVAFQLSAMGHWQTIGTAKINGAGDLVFTDGTVVSSDKIYQAAVLTNQPGRPQESELPTAASPGLPVYGPSIRIRR